MVLQNENNLVKTSPELCFEREDLENSSFNPSSESLFFLCSSSWSLSLSFFFLLSESFFFLRLLIALSTSINISQVRKIFQVLTF